MSDAPHPEVTLNGSALLVAQAAANRCFDEQANVNEIAKAAVAAYVAHAYSGDSVAISAMDVPGYEPLAAILQKAYDQSARGKGRERHNKDDLPFVAQPILAISRMVGIGYHTGQVMKKVQEATTMAGRGKYDAARAELLGAIVYTAAAFRRLDEISLLPAKEDDK